MPVKKEKFFIYPFHLRFWSVNKAIIGPLYCPYCLSFLPVFTPVHTAPPQWLFLSRPYIRFRNPSIFPLAAPPPHPRCCRRRCRPRPCFTPPPNQTLTNYNKYKVDIPISCIPHKKQLDLAAVGLLHLALAAIDHILVAVGLHHLALAAIDHVLAAVALLHLVLPAKGGD